jgi:hypothetical protein
MNQNIQNSVNNNNIDEYYRKISPQMTSNLLEIIEQINENNIENQVIINKIKFIRLLVDAMHDLFPQNHSNNNSNESLGSHQQLRFQNDFNYFFFFTISVNCEFYLTFILTFILTFLYFTYR